MYILKTKGEYHLVKTSWIGKCADLFFISAYKIGYAQNINEINRNIALVRYFCNKFRDTDAIKTFIK